MWWWIAKGEWTVSEIAIDSRRGEFPRDSIRISITEALKILPGIVKVGQALMRAQAPHGNTVHLNIGE